jgi:hypothetical protein
MIRPEICDFEPEWGLKRSQTQPKIPGTVPTDRHTTIPTDPGPTSACFDDDPKLSNCETAQPSRVSSPPVSAKSCLDKSFWRAGTPGTTMVETSEAAVHASVGPHFTAFVASMSLPRRREHRERKIFRQA